MPDVRRLISRIPVARSRPARLMLLIATAFIVAAITIARLPQHDSQAAAQRAAATNTTSSNTVTNSNTEPAASPTGDPFGNEGAVAATSDEQAPAGSLNGGRFSMPLGSWTKVTDRFGAPRGGGLIHGGIDLALDHHTPVSAACKGTVIYTGYNGTYGNHVIIDCGDGFTTLYGHLSQVMVAKDQAVDNTVVIGLSGSTGFSTGEHLHFEIRLNDVPVNPENYLDFHIAPGTPLSDGPIWFPGSDTPGAAAAAATATEVPTETATPKPTATPIPPTATPTNTPTPTPTPKSAKKAPTPPPVSQH
jgi:murein DD-endopeptidase MepM/ murein hydrolase activator NlpD